MLKRRVRKGRAARAAVHRELKLTWRQKWWRLKDRLMDPEWRRYAKLLMAGRFLGLATLAIIVFIVLPQLHDLVLGAPAMAQAPAPDPYAAIKPADHINAMNTGWVLLGAFLVFGMQAGFTMPGSGLLSQP